MRRSITTIFFFSTLLLAKAQSIATDTISLQPVLIQAYATDRPIEEIAASIGYVDTRALTRFSNTSILPAVNTVPGVRMEERSPGSYRFSIRGSLLRSPFGVRNVKVYWNGLPFTDGGGNTYLNLVDFSSIGSLEIIKGPGGSLYGAGTGGVLLLNSPNIKADQLEASAIAGSYGLQRYVIAGQIHRQKFNGRIQYAHQQSDGYRDQTAMTRDAVNADLDWALAERTTLSSTIFFSRLNYETPGGLTLTQFQEDPSQARPATATLPSAPAAHAAVSNNTPFIGLSLEHEWNNQWTTKLGVFASTSDFNNPTIRNYESRGERNLGARSETQFAFGTEKKSKITFGAEFQLFKSDIDIFDNLSGSKGSAQTHDQLKSRLVTFFGQAEYDLPANFFLTAGGSWSFTYFDFERSYPLTQKANRDLAPAFSPRIALLNKITPGFAVYVSVSKGFSPPSLAELYPSTQVWNNSIQPEQGINLEAGFKGHRFHHSLEFDVAVYRFKLKDALVIRRGDDGADYFVNAGETVQKGLEALVAWHPIRNASTLVSDFRLSNSYAFSDYEFGSYVQGTNDYSGNKITGIPPIVNTSALDIAIRKFYLNTTLVYSDHTPLTDDNTAYAHEYLLFGSRLGWKANLKKIAVDIFAGVDNLLDRKYSLGNDLNATGGRFFNAAPGRNYFGGMKISFKR